MSPRKVAAESPPITAFPPISKWQDWVWLHRNYWWMLHGGRRIGKSSVASHIRGADNVLHGKTVNWYCANKELANENWQAVCDFLGPYSSRMNRHEDGEMWFDTARYGKGVFKRRSGFSKWAGRAATADLLVFDEMQLLDRELYMRATPSILTTRGSVVGALTSPSTPVEFEKSQWIAQIIENALPSGLCADPRLDKWFVTSKPTEPQDIAFFYMMTDIGTGVVDDSMLQWYNDVFTYDERGYTQAETNKQWDNYIKTAIDFLVQAKYEIGEDDYNREYGALWKLESSRLVYRVMDGKHRNMEFHYDDKLDESVTVWAIDRGEGLGWHVLNMYQRYKKGERTPINIGYQDLTDHKIPIYAYRAFDEIGTPTVISESDMLQRALDLCVKKGYPLPKYVIYDIRAPGYRMEIMNAGLVPIARNVLIEDGIRKVRRKIELGLVEVHPNCTRLWQNLTNYSRDEKGFPIDNRDNDAADELRYMVWIMEMLGGVPSDDAYDNREIRNQLAEEHAIQDSAVAEMAGAYWFTF